MTQPVTPLTAPIAAPVPTPIAEAHGRSRGRWFWWLVVVLAALYFLVPLVATLLFSLRARPALAAYASTFRDPQFAGSLIFSFAIGALTILISIALILPTAVWVRLRMPRLQPVVELVTLVPFVIPPVILVFGLIRSYGSGPLALTGSDLGSDLLLVAAYVVLSLPYMYRAVDTGLRAMDLRTLTEAAQSVGAGWPRILVQVVLPNLRVSLLSGAFLTLAIVIGEFTIATFLARPAFGPYLSLLGQNRAYEPAAVSLVSFGIAWLAMGVIQLIGRGSGPRVPIAGAGR